MGLHTQALCPPRCSCQPSPPEKRSKSSSIVKTSRNARSVVLVDSPNATRCVASIFGPHAKPDWDAMLRLGGSLGTPVRGIVAVNDGIPQHVVQRFRETGYAVQFSHARDVDDRVVAQAVRMVDRAQVFVIVSGDGGYCSLVTLLRRLHKRVIVVAVESCCHPRLRAVADGFRPIPVLTHSVAKLLEER
jgi:uncharacterized LabA/DUF88 family protein